MCNPATALPDIPVRKGQDFDKDILSGTTNAKECVRDLVFHQNPLWNSAPMGAGSMSVHAITKQRMYEAMCAKPSISIQVPNADRATVSVQFPHPLPSDESNAVSIPPFTPPNWDQENLPTPAIASEESIDCDFLKVHGTCLQQRGVKVAAPVVASVGRTQSSEQIRAKIATKSPRTFAKSKKSASANSSPTTASSRLAKSSRTAARTIPPTDHASPGENLLPDVAESHPVRSPQDPLRCTGAYTKKRANGGLRILAQCKNDTGSSTVLAIPSPRPSAIAEEICKTSVPKQSPRQATAAPPEAGLSAPKSNAPVTDEKVVATETTPSQIFAQHNNMATEAKSPASGHLKVFKKAAPPNRRRFSAGTQGPKSVIERVAQNDPTLTKVDMSASAVFGVKSDEYSVTLADALRCNTHVVELNLEGCDIKVRCMTTVMSPQFLRCLFLGISLQRQMCPASGCI